MRWPVCATIPSSPEFPQQEKPKMAVELNTEATTLQRIKSGKLVEGLEHMSPTYLEGIKRILTVSADTELISAPAYFRAAQDAPSLNAFGTAISIVQDELAHAHIAYRLLEDLGADKDWLIYQRPAGEWKYPYAFDVPLDSCTSWSWPTPSTIRPATSCSATSITRRRLGHGSALWPRSTK